MIDISALLSVKLNGKYLNLIVDCILTMVIPHINNECYLPVNYFNQLETINNLQFTSREIDVISCIINMRGSSKIASILNVSPRTAESHIANIKRKIDNNSREGIIDFVEKSGKTPIIRTHYQNLLIQAKFYKKLQSISTTIKNQANLVRYLITCHEKDEKVITKKIINDLTFAGIQLIALDQQQTETIGPKQNEHFIYIISNKSNQQFIKLFKQLQHKSNIYTIIAIDTMDPTFSKKLGENQFIYFTEQKNYHLTIFEIIKKILPNIELNKTIVQFKAYNQSILDQPRSITTLSSNVTETNQNNNNLKFKLFKNLKWLIILALLVIINIILIFGYNKMDSRTPKQIVSYMPEVLAGHEYFVGRKKELQLIKHFLDQNNIIILSGRAGVGKSSCAIQYGKIFKHNKIVRYFNAEFATKINQQYKTLAQELNIHIDGQPKEVIMQLVNNKLNSIHSELLFIFDNVEQYDYIKEYLANLPTNVQAIVTTRQPMLIANNPNILIEEFSNSEAEEYLQNSLQNRHLHNELIHNLAKNIGTLPYDLKCAAAYVLDNPSIEINTTVIQEISNKIKDQLFQEFIVSHDNVTQQAWQILQYAALLDPDFIGVEIINKLFSQEKVVLTSAALKKLESLSLISIINDQQERTGFKIHRKLQNSVLNTIKHNSKHSISNQKLIENLLNTLDLLFPDIIHSQNTIWQIAAGLQPHIEKLLNIGIQPHLEEDRYHYANLYYKLAKYYLRVNVNYQKALDCAKTSLNERHKLYQNNHPDLANSFNIIGVIYRRLGDITEGLKYTKEGLKIRQFLYSGDHPDIEDSLKHIGTAYLQNGETQQGLKYSKMALNMSQKLYSGNHYEIARSLNAVGMCYLDLGYFEKSLEYIIASLDMFSTLNPINYERIAALQSNLSYNYNKLGNYVEAIKYAKSSVDIFKKFYPNGHPRAIYSLGDYGYSLLIANKITKGLDILHQALTMSKNFNMNRHYVTAHVLHDLGWGYLKNKDYKTALEYTTQALNLRKEIYVNAKNHPELAETLHNLGNIHVALNNKNEGLLFFKEAIKMYTTLSLEHLSEANEIKQKIKELDSC